MPHKDIETRRAYGREYMRRHRNKWDRDYKRNHHYKRYGISLEDYNQMFMDQNGCCAICFKHQSDFEYNLHVDHCHETGKVRGLLCKECNTGLGYFYDNIDNLANALVYLENSR